MVDSPTSTPTLFAREQDKPFIGWGAVPGADDAIMSSFLELASRRSEVWVEYAEVIHGRDDAQRALAVKFRGDANPEVVFERGRDALLLPGLGLLRQRDDLAGFMNALLDKREGFTAGVEVYETRDTLLVLKGGESATIDEWNGSSFRSWGDAPIPRNRAFDLFLSRNLERDDYQVSEALEVGPCDGDDAIEGIVVRYQGEGSPIHCMHTLAKRKLRRSRLSACAVGYLQGRLSTPCREGSRRIAGGDSSAWHRGTRNPVLQLLPTTKGQQGEYWPALCGGELWAFVPKGVGWKLWGKGFANPLASKTGAELARTAVRAYGSDSPFIESPLWALTDSDSGSVKAALVAMCTGRGLEESGRCPDGQVAWFAVDEGGSKKVPVASFEILRAAPPPSDKLLGQYVQRLFGTTSADESELPVLFRFGQSGLMRTQQKLEGWSR